MKSESVGPTVRSFRQVGVHLASVAGGIPFERAREAESGGSLPVEPGYRVNGARQQRGGGEKQHHGNVHSYLLVTGVHGDGVLRFWREPDDCRRPEEDHGGERKERNGGDRGRLSVD